MNMMHRRRTGFSLIELLVTVSILGLLISILVPSLKSARDQARTVVCGTQLRTLAQGWVMYADENQDIALPARMPGFASGGLSNPENLYEVSNGIKYRPRWPVLMQGQVGVPALNRPKDDRNRQNYNNDAYICPTVSRWTDERNAAYGYNYQFLGSHRRSGSEFRNLPVPTSRIRKASGTISITDSNGSAASFPTRERLDYLNEDREERRRGNYGWLIDPPRLRSGSSRAGGPGSRRSAPDARHRGKANAAFADGHVVDMTLQDMGYGVRQDGSVVDSGLGAHNRLFSGTGRDKSPP